VILKVDREIAGGGSRSESERSSRNRDTISSHRADVGPVLEKLPEIPTSATIGFAEGAIAAGEAESEGMPTIGWWAASRPLVAGSSPASFASGAAPHCRKHKAEYHY
jgi:hypothetical protein